MGTNVAVPEIVVVVVAVIGVVFGSQAEKCCAMVANSASKMEIRFAVQIGTKQLHLF
jgi:hypothetical protein